RVTRDDRGLDAVQLELVERVAHSEHDGFGHIAIPRVVLIHPIPNERRLERAALHAAEAHLADELTASQEDAESVRHVEVALALPRAASRPERLDVGNRIGAPSLRGRLPPLEPFAAADAHRAPALPVVGAQPA